MNIMKEQDNSRVREWLLVNEILSVGDFPDWLDDVITGAARLNGSEFNTTKPTSRGVILSMLLCHDVLSTDTIRATLSRKNEAIYGKPVTIRYAQLVKSRVTSASKSIEYFLEKSKNPDWLALQDESVKQTLKH